MLSETVRLIHALTWLCIALIHGILVFSFHPHDLALWSLLPPSLNVINVVCLSLTLFAYAKWATESSFRIRAFLCTIGLAQCVSASIVFRSVELYENHLSSLSFLFLLQAALPALSALTDVPEFERGSEFETGSELPAQPHP